MLLGIQLDDGHVDKSEVDSIEQAKDRVDLSHAYFKVISARLFDGLDEIARYTPINELTTINSQSQIVNKDGWEVLAKEYQREWCR